MSVLSRIQPVNVAFNIWQCDISISTTVGKKAFWNVHYFRLITIAAQIRHRKKGYFLFPRISIDACSSFFCFSIEIHRNLSINDHKLDWTDVFIWYNTTYDKVYANINQNQNSVVRCFHIKFIGPYRYMVRMRSIKWTSASATALASTSRFCWEFYVPNRRAIESGCFYTQNSHDKTINENCCPRLRRMPSQLGSHTKIKLCLILDVISKYHIIQIKIHSLVLTFHLLADAEKKNDAWMSPSKWTFAVGHRKFRACNVAKMRTKLMKIPISLVHTHTHKYIKIFTCRVILIELARSNVLTIKTQLNSFTFVRIRSFIRSFDDCETEQDTHTMNEQERERHTHKFIAHCDASI